MYVLELAGEDEAFATAEARAAATDVSVAGHGIAVAADVDEEQFRGLAYVHRAGEYVDEIAGTVRAAASTAREMPLEREGTVAVRARDVHGTADVDTQDAERRVGQALVDRGLSVDLDDPDHELRVLFAGDRCFLAWLTVESVRDYGDRKPTDRPFFQPGSMDPLLARAVCNLARVEPGDRVLDPMCGTGGVLVEAGLLGARPLGTDAQAKMVRGARQNLAHYLADFDVARADATTLPLRDDAVDAVVFDAPYGRQSKIETHDLADLVAGALREARRVADRCVLVADRDWREAAGDAGWTVESRFERRVHRSLTRYVLVLA
ncbi:MAG: TIGR01177 family methyltransferase [Halobacterium sp.]